jgi:hypothetical protein
MRALTLSLLLCLVPTVSVAAPPSDESIEELLAVTRAEAMTKDVWPHIQAMVNKMIAEDGAKRNFSPEQHAQFEKVMARVVGAMQEELSWERLRALYFKLYRETFQQEDVDGMLAFYRSPAGEAMLAKMPLLMQNLMREMGDMSRGMQRRMRAEIDAAVAEIEADKRAQREANPAKT